MNTGIIIIIVIIVIYFLTREKSNKDKYINGNEFFYDVKNGEIEQNNNNQNQVLENIFGNRFFEEKYSNNKKYCVVFRDRRIIDNKWNDGIIALIKDRTLLFKKKIQRPNDCHVSNNGIIICCDWLKSEKLTGNFLIFDNKGNQLFTKKTTANLRNCEISDDGKIVIFATLLSKTNDSNKIFVVDVEKKVIINKFKPPIFFEKAIINSSKKRIKFIVKKRFIFEIDFAGNQTNKEEYKNQIMTKGSTYDKFWFYYSKKDHLKFEDSAYLEILENSLMDIAVLNSIRKDKLYRIIGEYYEANGNINKTIENWEKAITINPKVGIKKKLDDLKKEKL